MREHVRKDELVRWGFDPVDVLDAISIAYQGDVVGQFYEENESLTYRSF